MSFTNIYFKFLGRDKKERNSEIKFQNSKIMFLLFVCVQSNTAGALGICKPNLNLLKNYLKQNFNQKPRPGFNSRRYLGVKMCP